MAKKILAMLLAVVMLVGMLAGCNPQKPVETQPKETQGGSKETQPKETEPPVVEFSYPMEGKKLTHALSIRGQQEAAGLNNMGESKFAKLVAEKTGVEVEYIQGRDADNWISLMLAEGDYPDVMEAWWTNVYPGGIQAMGTDEVIIPLNDVIDQYMPNFKAWLDANPELAAQLYNSEGVIYGIPCVYESTDTLNTTGLIIRQDWLKELGLSVPTTIDEWYTVLKAFKEQKGVIPFCNITKYFLQDGFMKAYVPAQNYCIDPNTGKITYGQYTDAYKEFLTTMNQWYEEGLIDPDIAALDYATVNVKRNNSEIGALYGWNSSIENMTVEADVLVAAPTPMKSAGALNFHASTAQVTKYHAVISTNCEDVEAAARYLDWFWSEEGKLASNFGIEGESYVMVDGSPEFTDLVLKNPDGLDKKAVMGDYIIQYSAAVGMIMDAYTLSQSKRPTTRESYGIWGSSGSSDYNLPADVKLTEEEAARVAEIEAELKTHISEYCTKFLIGTADIETEWADYIKLCEQFGIKEVIEIYQAAYDRYLAG